MNDAPIELILSGSSLVITIYFWLVQARRERPDLRTFQTSGLRAMLRRIPECDDKKRLCVQPQSPLGLLIANNSSRQNSIVLFECWLYLPNGDEIRGDWGTIGDDQPPWNVGPDSTISMSIACFFDVPADFEIPQRYAVRIALLTANGQRFWQTLSSTQPAALTSRAASSRAA